MFENPYLNYQVKTWMSGNLAHFDISSITPSLDNLHESLLATILSHALPERRAGFIPSIMNTAKMFTKTATARPPPSFLLVNKKLLHIGKQVWSKTDFAHVYVNSWTPLHKGLISSIGDFPFVCLTINIRRGERALGEKLVPSAFGAKLRELLKELQSVEVLLIRVWHGPGSLGPVSEIIMNNFKDVRVAQAINIASIVSTDRGIDKDRGCPGLLSEFYMENFVSHLLRKSPSQFHRLNLTNTHTPDLPLKQVPKPTTAYLDDSEPLLKIPIWRGCAAAHESVNSACLPAVEEPAKSEDKDKKEALSTEEEEAFAQEFKEKMMHIPWVGTAARAARREEAARKKGKKKKLTGEKKEPTGEKKVEEV
jgi:hypothetical protein